MRSTRRCELCNNGATLHCDADSAYLCWGCDAKVHAANFLVARHVRIILCCRCHEFTDISTREPCSNVAQCLCSGCRDVNPLRISTTESDVSKCHQKKRMITKYGKYWDMKMEVILRRWYRYLNLRSPSTVMLAMYLVKGLRKLGCLFRQKWRICLASSLWIAATLCENEVNLPSIKKVEECTGVPSRLILLVESRLATILDWKMHDEEGSGESNQN